MPSNLAACLGLFLLPLLASVGNAADRLITTDDQEVSGTVVQATRGVVILELDTPLPEGDPRTSLLESDSRTRVRLPAARVSEIVWGNDPLAESAAELLLQDWTTIDPRSSNPLHRNPNKRSVDLLPSMSNASPQTLAVLERLVLENSPRLEVQLPGQPPVAPVPEGAPAVRRPSLLLPIAQALLSLQWWNTESIYVALLIQSDDRLTQTEAVRGLIELATVRSIEALAPLLAEDNPALAPVPQILARLSSEGHAAKVLEAVTPFLTAEDGAVRYRALVSLEGGNLAVASTPLAAAAGDPDPNVRRTVARLLATSEEREHGRILLDIALGDDDPEARRLALLGLKDSRHLFAIEPLIELGESAEDPVLANHIAICLGGTLTGGNNRYGTKWQTWRAWFASHGQRMVETADERLTPGQLADQVFSGSIADRVNAIGLLTAQPKFLSNEDVFEIARATDEPRLVRLAALRALTRRGDLLRRRNPEFFEEFLELLENAGADEELRRLYRNVLAAMSVEKADLGDSVELWRDYLRFYQAPNAEALENLAREALDGTNVPLKKVALNVISSRGLVELRYVLIDFLTSANSDKGQKLLVLRTLARMGKRDAEPLQDPEVIEALIEFLPNVDPNLRSTAEQALRQITGQRHSFDTDAWYDWLDAWERER